MERTEIVASALGSTRAEGLEPSAEAVALLDAWARGDITDDELKASESLAFAGQLGTLATT